ncbi:MAG: hypothetical protein P4L56_29180 [Candidatus Sulfopaludibacter sp.]|nr:hypothetical protein [Candidatus Sulfopaludibacter sp.]
MDIKIILSGNRAVCLQDGKEAFAAPLSDFVERISGRGDAMTLNGPIPEGVRHAQRRGDATVLVLEDRPQTRTVRWLADDSPAPFGPGAVYRNVRLAFPFVVIIVVFNAGRLTGVQQCFYRTEPIQSLQDPLFYPNLYNCAQTPQGRGYSMESWLCLANLKDDFGPLTWEQRSQLIHHHVWGGAFNRSSEVHEGNSLWQSVKADPRVSTVERWAEESRQNPYFPLTVPWRPYGKSVGETADAMLATVAPERPVTDAASLVGMLLARPASRRARWMEMLQSVAGAK